MKKTEIVVGGHYKAKVNSRIVTVRVDAINEPVYSWQKSTSYSVTNLSTGRKTGFRSAAKFRSVAPGYNADGSKKLLAIDAIARGERFEGGSMEIVVDKRGETNQGELVEVGTRVKYLGHVPGGMVRVDVPLKGIRIMHPNCFAEFR